MNHPHPKPPTRALLTATLLLLTPPAHAQPLPPDITRQLPPGYAILATAQGPLTGAAQNDYAVALARPNDDPNLPPGEGVTAPRPLLIFRATSAGAYTLAGRNNAVVFRHDQGGQCDPFDPDRGLVITGRSITVQNEVACGDHWSDYITFRYSPARNALLFHTEIVHSWTFNPSTDPDAEAIIPNGPPTITRANPHHPVTFSAWQPSP